MAKSSVNFVRSREDHPLARTSRTFHRHEAATHDDILRRADNRRTVRRAEDVVGSHHQRMRFNLSFDRQRQMHCHLVAVEVCVESPAHERMKPNRVSFDKSRFECLDAHSVKRRSTVEHHRMVGDDFVQNIPDLFIFSLKHALRRLNRVCMPELLQTADDERLEQLKGNLFRQATLVKLQFRTDDDHASR